jgi:hypothetical protein
MFVRAALVIIVCTLAVWFLALIPVWRMIAIRDLPEAIDGRCVHVSSLLDAQNLVLGVSAAITFCPIAFLYWQNTAPLGGARGCNVICSSKAEYQLLAELERKRQYLELDIEELKLSQGEGGEREMAGVNLKRQRKLKQEFEDDRVGQLQLVVASRVRYMLYNLLMAPALGAYFVLSLFLGNASTADRGDGGHFLMPLMFLCGVSVVAWTFITPLFAANPVALRRQAFNNRIAALDDIVNSSDSDPPGSGGRDRTRAPSESKHAGPSAAAGKPQATRRTVASPSAASRSESSVPLVRLDAKHSTSSDAPRTISENHVKVPDPPSALIDVKVPDSTHASLSALSDVKVPDSTHGNPSATAIGPAAPMAPVHIAIPLSSSISQVSLAADLTPARVQNRDHAITVSPGGDSDEMDDS